MHKFTGAVAASFFGAALVVATAAPVLASEADPDFTEVGEATTPALYQGKVIDLAEGWMGAEVCSQQEEGAPIGFVCYEDTATAAAAEGWETDPLASADDVEAASRASCQSGKMCIYEFRGWGTPMLRFDRGTHNLADYSFRDRASSLYNNRSAESTLVDFRSGFVSDRTITFDPRQDIYDLAQVAYPGGGNWDSKADRVVVD